jgi:hypothetical protein
MAQSRNAPLHNHAILLMIEESDKNSTFGRIEGGSRQMSANPERTTGAGTVR